MEGYWDKLQQTWPARAAQGMWQGLMAPGNALASTTPMTSDQMIAPAANMAGMVTLGAGAMPAAANELRAGMAFGDKSSARIGLNLSTRQIEKYNAKNQAYMDGTGPKLTPAERADWIDAFKNKQSAQQYLDSSQPLDIGN